jgi:hypothetical protein
MSAVYLCVRSIVICGVMTGVQFVGWVDQVGVHKDRLEENSVIACLRSDLIAEMDKSAGRDPSTDPDLLVQTELLSLTGSGPKVRRSLGTAFRSATSRS